MGRYRLDSDGPLVRGSVVGDLAGVRALLSWGGSKVNLAAVGVLGLPQAVIAPQQAMTLARQLRRADELCDRMPAGALCLSARAAPGPVRAFACPDGPVLLLVAGGAGIWASEDGLVLRNRDLPGGSVTVRGWQVGAGSVRVSTPGGTLELGGTCAARLLTRLAPGVDEPVVHPAPLRAAFTGLLGHATDTAQRAAASDAAMLVWRERVR